MKLQTFIKPRRNGVVNVMGQDGQTYTFSDLDADGALVCDVACEATVARLLASGDFEPCNEDDIQRAIDLSIAGTLQSDADDADKQGDPDDEAFGDDDDEVSPGALPIEANTPPKPKAPAKAPAKGGAAAKKKAA